MVKVFGPMMSFDASGTLAKTAVFSKWKGRNYVRNRVIPANPQSGLQTGMRAMWKFLSQQWAAMSAGDKATYQNLADAGVVSTFNAYIKANQLRWRNFTTPAEAYPAAEVGTLGTAEGAEPTATGGVASVTITHELSAAADNWGFLLFCSTTSSFTPGLSNCIAAILMADTDQKTFVHSPLDPDTYYYNTMLFTNDGVVGAAEGEINATAT